MKQLLPLFLFLVPCLAWAQYPSNGNQKITLGEQTTADGLIWRGVASDTTLTAKSDTAAYFVLDTVNINLYTYKASATGRKWRQLGSDTAAIAYVNTYGTQTVNGAKTFSAATTFSNTATATKFIPTDSVRAGYGMYRVNSKTVGINANGVIPFRITDDGNWGLIDDNPQNLLTTFSSNSRGGVISNSYPILMFNEIGRSKFVFGLDENEAYLWGFTNVKLIIATNFTEKMRVETSGEVWIANTTDRGAYNLQVNGTGVWGEGAYVNGSDANIKENIIDLDSSLNIVNNLKPVVFNYINASVNNDTKHLGFIAQDVYQTLENKDYLGSIVRSDGDTLSIAYSNIIPLLTKAIQEQNALIKALEQRIINLENK
jgi:hypothetical protein